MGLLGAELHHDVAFVFRVVIVGVDDTDGVGKPGRVLEAEAGAGDDGEQPAVFNLTAEPGREFYIEPVVQREGDGGADVVASAAGGGADGELDRVIEFLNGAVGVEIIEDVPYVFGELLEGHLFKCGYFIHGLILPKFIGYVGENRLGLARVDDVETLVCGLAAETP